MLHLYIGDGKGKTSAALGLAIRASGFKQKVYIAQFLKDENFESGEIEALRRSNLPVKVERFFEQIHPMFLKGKEFSRDKLIFSIKEALLKIDNYIEMKRFDIFIFDEILNAVEEKFCSKALLKKILKKGEWAEIILTGRRAAQDFVNMADYVSLIKKIKHPFDKKIIARRGIEY